MRWSSLVVATAVAGCHGATLAPLTPRQVTLARLIRIEDTRRDEPAFVDSLLLGTDPASTARAALTVGRIGASAHVARLRQLAMHSDTGVAANAMFALGMLKDTASASMGAAALHLAAPVAIEAAWLLGELGDGGRGGIEAGLADAALSSPVRAALLLAATRLRPVPTNAILPFLGSADSALAWRAAYTLARGRSTTGARMLLGQASSPWGAVREQVARGASKRIAGDSLGAIARTALDRLIADTSARVRINAIQSIASYGATARAATRRVIRRWISMGTFGRPPREREFRRQYSRKPVRCHRMVVSGWIIVTAFNTDGNRR